MKDESVKGLRGVQQSAQQVDAGAAGQAATGARPVRPTSRPLSASVLVLSVAVGAWAALAGDAAAQEDDSPRDGDLTPSGVLSKLDDENLSTPERVERAKEFTASIEQASISIQRQLGIARKERDVVRVLCLNDKLNQVDVALRSARDRFSALKAAADRRDDDRANHEYTVLEVLNDRVRVLVNESNQCVGEETGFIGEAEVSVTVDPNLPDTDPSQPLSEVAPPPPPPEVSSPIE